MKTTTLKAPPKRDALSGIAGNDDSFVTVPSGCADFLARAAHDLRSPLGVIAEVLPTLQHDLAGHLTEEHKAMFKLADRSLYRLRTFVDRMRLVADLELSELSLICHPIPLGTAVQQAVDTMLTNEPRRGITVYYEGGEMSSAVNADLAKVNQIISELLSNAMRHASSKVHVAIEKDQDEVKVIVEDDGPGLSKAEEHALFRRFVSRPSRNGLGIGLSLARDLTRAHGGRLLYEKSKLPSFHGKGTGARFVVSLKAL
ncbi:MAG TPA: HAMP domain-containing sensor histidine kinase [Polyangiaceae bacterium]|nr:HAMP domain-containing sensor histidine kinase [Polyangiaceae bacterium]